MAKPYTFQFAAIGTQSWELPADGILTGFISTLSGAGLSWRPDVLATDYSAPTATKADSTLIVFSTLAGVLIPIFVPVSLGEIIFPFSRVQGSLIVYFDDLS